MAWNEGSSSPSAQLVANSIACAPCLSTYYAHPLQKSKFQPSYYLLHPSVFQYVSWMANHFKTYTGHHIHNIILKRLNINSLILILKSTPVSSFTLKYSTVTNFTTFKCFVLWYQNASKVHDTSFKSVLIHWFPPPSLSLFLQICWRIWLSTTLHWLVTSLLRKLSGFSTDDETAWLSWPFIFWYKLNFLQDIWSADLYLLTVLQGLHSHSCLTAPSLPWRSTCSFPFPWFLVQFNSQISTEPSKTTPDNTAIEKESSTGRRSV